MKSIKFLSIIQAALLAGLLFNFSFAEETKTDKVVPDAKPVEVIEGQKAKQEEITKEVKKEEAKTPEKKEECACEKKAIDALTTAYTAVEESDWDEAIIDCKKNISEIESIKKCECTDIEAYINATTACLHYAQGGFNLDMADEIDCTATLEHYKKSKELIALAKTKIKNPQVVEMLDELESIRADEEEFTKDECVE